LTMRRVRVTFGLLCISHYRQQSSVLPNLIDAIKEAQKSKKPGSNLAFS